MSFFGNPNAQITAIDTSGGISCSRTSGQTPCFVQVSASAITCTGVIVNTDGSTNSNHSVEPFQDLEYSWDFGDAAGTEIFTDPVAGTSVNANSAQNGPKAAYVYRSAGTYTVTLTIRGKNGSSFTTASVTQAITVTTYNASGGSWYFDWDAAGGGDGSQGSPFNTIAQFNTKAAIANVALFVKRGGHNTTSATVAALGAGPLRLDAYGSGNKPIWEMASGGANPTMRYLLGASSTGANGDIVVSNQKVMRSGSGTGFTFTAVNSSTHGASANDIYLDNVDHFSSVSSGTGGGWCNIQVLGASDSRIGVWSGSCTADVGDLAKGLGYFHQTNAWAFYVGISSITGLGDSNTTLDHHIYPVTRTNSLFRWINFGSGSGRNYCINTDWEPANGDTSPATAQYHLIDACNGTGTNRFHDGADANNSTDTTRFVDFVCQRCAIHDMAGAVASGPFFAGITSGTWRFNNFWNNIDANFCFLLTNPQIAGLAKERIYFNNFYQTTISNGNPLIDYVGASFTQVQQITDNVIYSTVATAQLIALQTCSGQQSAGSLIDRNRYYGPNVASAKLWYDNASALTFAQWQAFGFDASGRIGDPHWPDPGNGIFAAVGRGDIGDAFSIRDVQRLRRNQEELKHAQDRRQKDEHRTNLRKSVEETYNKLAGIDPQGAKQIAAVIPVKAKAAAKAAPSIAPAPPVIDWRKLTAANTERVIREMEAYAARMTEQQRQQALARSEILKRQQQDDEELETFLMSLV